MGLQRRELMEKPDAIFIRFAHADDSAAANRNPGFTNIFQRPKPVLVITCGDDLAIKVGGRVEIMVVRMEPGLSQTPGTTYWNREPAYLCVYAPTSFGWRELLLKDVKLADGSSVVDDQGINAAAYDKLVRPAIAWRTARV